MLRHHASESFTLIMHGTPAPSYWTLVQLQGAWFLGRQQLCRAKAEPLGICGSQSDPVAVKRHQAEPFACECLEEVKAFLIECDGKASIKGSTVNEPQPKHGAPLIPRFLIVAGTQSGSRSGWTRRHLPEDNTMQRRRARSPVRTPHDSAQGSSLRISPSLVT